MPTSFDTVIDMVMIIIRDYKLDALFDEDEATFRTVMDGFIVKSVPKFKVKCMKSLSYDVANRTFNEELDEIEVDIIANLTALTWYMANVQDVLEFKEQLRDSDFNMFAKGQNLKPRHTYIDDLNRRIEQSITNYQFQYLGSFDYFGG